MREFSAGGLTRIVRRAGTFDQRRSASALLALLATEGARAEEALRGIESPSHSLTDMASLGAFLLAMLLAVVTVFHLIARRKWFRRLSELEVDLARTAAKLDRAALILRSEPDITICWDRPDDEPTIEGDLSLVSGEPGVRRVLDYSCWLDPAAAAQVEEAAERLLSHGDPFLIAAVTLRGRHLEISGRPVSGNAVMRIRDVSGERLQLAKMRERIVHAEGASGGASTGLGIRRDPRLGKRP